MNIQESLNTRCMNMVKLVHSISPEEGTEESHRKHRVATEQAAKLATPTSGISFEKLEICDIPSELVIPDFPHRKDRIILYCHGGGYTNGGLNYAGILAAKMAQNTGLSVVTFAYSLSPEAKYPVQLNEAEQLYNALLYQGYGAKQIILAGDSAGGNLALELVLRLKEQQRMMPKAMILFSPWTDLRLVNESYETQKNLDPIITREYLEMARKEFAGEDAEFSDPRYSPLLADLSGLPPVLIQVGELEVLRDDSKKLAQALRHYHVKVTFEKYQKGWHVFQQMPIPLAGAAMKSAGVFVMGLDV